MFSARREMNTNYLRLTCWRLLSSNHFKSLSHYDVLEITPKATQAEIKAAYYKLSMLHHPDRNKGTSEKFQAITAAYEVLSNYNSRRLYDKGMYGPMSQTYAADDPKNVYGRKDSSARYSSPATRNRNPIYDFDEWSRIHYGQTFARKAEEKARYERNLAGKNAAHKKENVMLCVLLLIVLFFILDIVFNNDLDKPENRNKNTSQNNGE